MSGNPENNAPRTGPARHAPRAATAVALLATGFALATPALAQTSPDSGWVRLFNGRDLDGWIVKITGLELGQDPARTFRVQDGLLKVTYDAYDLFNGAFGHLFYHSPFSDYLLRIEYRFTGEQVAGGPSWALRNSGVMVHSQAPGTMARHQDFPVSIEFQFLGGTGAGERPTGNLCTPGTNVVIDGQLVTRHCTNANAPTRHGDAWVTADIEVHGDSLIRHFIDGKPVLEYSRPQLDPADTDAQRLIHGSDLALRAGWIALQSESHPIEFRSVLIRPLGPQRAPGTASMTPTAGAAADTSRAKPPASNR